MLCFDLILLCFKVDIVVPYGFRFVIVSLEEIKPYSIRFHKMIF